VREVGREEATEAKAAEHRGRLWPLYSKGEEREARAPREQRLRLAAVEADGGHARGGRAPHHGRRGR